MDLLQLILIYYYRTTFGDSVQYKMKGKDCSVQCQ